MMESEDADLSKQFAAKRDEGIIPETDGDSRPKFPAVDNDARKPRSDEDMQREAQWLAQEMAKDAEAAS
jgi:bis(5'-adenosyl)-triphosphatase